MARPCRRSPPVALEAHVHLLSALGSVLLAAVLAAGALAGHPGEGRVRRLLRSSLMPLRHLHCGHVGDYVAWQVLGAAALAGALLLALHPSPVAGEHAMRPLRPLALSHEH